MADAYSFIPDWADVLYQQVIVNGDFSYLEEYKQRGLLKASTIEEIAQKWVFCAAIWLFYLLSNVEVLFK